MPTVKNAITALFSALRVYIYIYISCTVFLLVVVVVSSRFFHFFSHFCVTVFDNTTTHTGVYVYINV